MANYAKKEKQNGEKPVGISPASNRYYVRHPIMRGGELGGLVTVLGGENGKGAMYHIPRKHVIEVAAGAEASVEKWLNRNCIEPYNPTEHADAILGGGPAPVVEKKNLSQSNPILMEEEPNEDDAPKRTGDQATPIGT